MITNQSLYLNENRVIQITLYDQDGAAFIPTLAYYSIKDDSGTEVVAETTATISSNTVSAIIGTTVTATAGEYDIIWKIVQGVYIYYNKTLLIVQEI